MDREAILAVAGSGKTRLLIDRLNLEERFLITTYTRNNLANLRHRVIKKFGYLPDNIRICTFFTFLYSFCFKPYLSMKMGATGINWKAPQHRYIKENEPRYFMDSENRLYSCRIAKLLEKEGLISEIKHRLEKYFDYLLVDEVQDVAGHDFNFLMSISDAKIHFILVGDFFQHTFDTSRDGNVNKSLHDNYEKYKKRLNKYGIFVDTSRLNRSHRCKPSVCKFVTDEIGIKISSAYTHGDDSVELLSDINIIAEKLTCSKTIKLFFERHWIYPCFSQNWGASKGVDEYEDVCVVLNDNTHRMMRSGELSALPPMTKNKLYVACTRARGSIFFVHEKLVKQILNIDTNSGLTQPLLL